MHCGSAYAVCTPDPVIKNGGTTWRPNKLQKLLYDTWVWVKDSLSQKPHVLCLNGEPCDGSNYKSLGMQSWTTSIDDQVNDAYKLLKMFKANHFVMTVGSGYHSQQGADTAEENLASRLNCVPYSSYFSRDVVNGKSPDHNRNYKSFTDYLLYFSIFGRVFNVSHHIGYTSIDSNRTSAIAKEAALLKYLTGRYWDVKDEPTFIVRSHVHYFAMIRFSTTCAFTTCAWKLPDAHLFRKGMAGTAPSIGAVEVIVEQNGKWEVNPLILDNNHYPKHNILRF